MSKVSALAGILTRGAAWAQRYWISAGFEINHDSKPAFSGIW
jgi:hypothetical protein